MKKGDVVTLKSEYRNKDNGHIRYGERLIVCEVLVSNPKSRFTPYPKYVTFDVEPGVENKNYYPALWFRNVDDDEFVRL